MSKVYEFNFEPRQLIEEIKVNGETFTIDFSDKNLRKIQVAFLDYSSKNNELSKEVEKIKDHKKATDFAIEKAKEILKSLIESMLIEENAFDKIYKLSGESIVNIANFVRYLMGVVEKKLGNQKQTKREQYVKPKKGKK